MLFRSALIAQLPKTGTPLGEPIKQQPPETIPVFDDKKDGKKGNFWVGIAKKVTDGVYLLFGFSKSVYIKISRFMKAAQIEKPRDEAHMIAIIKQVFGNRPVAYKKRLRVLPGAAI